MISLLDSNLVQLNTLYMTYISAVRYSRQVTTLMSL